MPSSNESQLGLDRSLKVDTHNLPNGAKGNLRTVELMIKIAKQKATDKIVRQLGINILNDAGTQSHNHLDEAIAIGEWVKQNVRYMKDPYGTELLQDPLLMIEKCDKGECRGDCDDMALLTATLLISIGIKPYFKIVRWKDMKGSFNHIYCMVFEGNYKQPKKMFALDCIIKDRPMGTELKSASHDLIEVKL